MDCIAKLQELGYQFTVTGGRISYKFTGSREPDVASVRPLLAELKTRKQEAIAYLRPCLRQIHDRPDSRPEADWRKLLRETKAMLTQAAAVRNSRAANKAFTDACYANACLNWLKSPYSSVNSFGRK
ncbi:MAG: hypothetical protein XD78_1117 [Desulfotomaculum sp. 46_296]|nr:MAG: hypothetical protein XD78_1117 [Desulfotomaculum sp. 46_296]